PWDLGQGTAERALPLRIGTQIQALPRRTGVSRDRGVSRPHPVSRPQGPAKRKRTLALRAMRARRPRSQHLPRAQYELVPVRVFENRKCPPWLLRRWFDEFDAALAELAVRGFHVVAGERTI